MDTGGNLQVQLLLLQEKWEQQSSCGHVGQLLGISQKISEAKYQNE